MSAHIHASELLEKASGQADAAEVYQVRSLQMPVKFTAGALDLVRTVETSGRALRVVKDGRLGFSTTTDLRDDATVVGNALASAQFGDPVALQFPSPQPASAVQCFDRQVEQLSERDLIALGKEIIARIRDYDPEVQVHVSLNKACQDVHLLNSSGLDVESRRTSFEIDVTAERAREGDILLLDWSASSRRRQDVDGMAIADYLIERLRWAERIVEVDSKAMPVVFHRYGTLPLLLPLMAGLNGHYVLMGISPLGQRLGQRVLDEKITLVDDGRLDFAPRSVPYDDEGTPTSEKTLLEHGVVRQFLYDLRTAARGGTQPTGNGFKASNFSEGSYAQPPGVNPCSWLVQPGSHSLERILQNLDEALLVESVLGLGQGNVVAGEFSNNVAPGFLVRRGEVVGRVKKTMVAGNVYELLKDNLIALSDRPAWVWGWMHVPAIAVDGVSVISQT